MIIQGYAYNILPHPWHPTDKTKLYSLMVLKTDEHLVPLSGEENKVPLMIPGQLLAACRCDPYDLSGKQIAYREEESTLTLERQDRKKVIREGLDLELIVPFPHGTTGRCQVLLSEKVTYEGVLKEVFRYGLTGEGISDRLVALLSQQSPYPQEDVRVEFKGSYQQALEGLQDYLWGNIGHPLSIDRTVKRNDDRDDLRSYRVTHSVENVATGEKFEHVDDILCGKLQNFS